MGNFGLGLSLTLFSLTSSSSKHGTGYSLGMHTTHEVTILKTRASVYTLVAQRMSAIITYNFDRTIAVTLVFVTVQQNAILYSIIEFGMHRFLILTAGQRVGESVFGSLNIDKFEGKLLDSQHQPL